MTPYWNCDRGNLLWRESGDLKQRSLPYISEIYILQFVRVIYRIQINFIVFHRRQTIAYALQEALLLLFQSERGHGDASIKELFQTNYPEEKFSLWYKLI